MRPRIGSLFSGAGGLDLAVEDAFGGRTVWHSELDEAASNVLAHRWPGVPNLGNITLVDWSTVESIDILCGGFPCQDVSPAGRRAGLKDGTRSGLWAMFAAAIKALRPKVVVIENVRGLLSADGEEWPPEVVAADAEAARLSRVVALINSKIKRAIREGWWHGEYKQRKQFESTRLARLRDRALARFRTLRSRLVQRAIGTVVADLAYLGYDAQWTTISAASIGAPHKRERVFILATDTSGDGRPRINGGPGIPSARGGRDGFARRSTGRSSAVEPARFPSGDVFEYVEMPIIRTGGRNIEDVADALLPTPRRSDGDGGANPLSRAERMDDIETRIIRLLQTPSAADGDGSRKARGGARCDEPLLPGQAIEMANAWGKYEPAIRRWEKLTRPAPSPVELSTNGNPRLAPAFPEWMQGFEAGWITAVPGISRNDQLRIIGNSVCPQQAVAALNQLRWIEVAA